MNKHERQIRLFGEEGQKKLKDTEIIIVGVGGVGSHIAQQLAYLGVGKITIIDEDRLEDTNLNRLVGAYDNDPVGKPKVEIIERLIKNINPEIEVEPLDNTAISEKGLDALKNSKFIFGCVDNDGVRSFINEVVQAFEIPCIDVATEIHQEDLEYGGRMIFIDSKGCLSCCGELDHEEVRKYFENPDAKQDWEEIYGVNKKDLTDSGPSVVTVNGILASLATTEFMAYITGLRKPNKCLTYYGSSGIVTKTSERIEGCYYCNIIRGSKITSYQF